MRCMCSLICGCLLYTSESIEARESFVAVRDDRRFIPIIQGESDEYSSQAVSPIICEGDAIGEMCIRDSRIPCCGCMRTTFL